MRRGALVALVLGLAACTTTPRGAEPRGGVAPPPDAGKAEAAQASRDASPDSRREASAAGPRTEDAPARVAALDAETRRRVLDAWEADNWTGRPAELTAKALAAYEQGDLELAHEWNALARWQVLMSQPEDELQLGWRNHMEQAGLWRPELHALLNARRGLSLALRLPRELRRGIAERPDCLDAYLVTVSRLDAPVQVLGVLAELHAAAPGDFWDYFPLALAFAVVRDVPPPAHWPHRQAGPAAGRGFQTGAAELFRYYVDLDRAGASLLPLRRAQPRDLKHLADASVGLAELHWAREASRGVPLRSLDKLYSGIPYRMERLRKDAMHWPWPEYTLCEVARRGGICVDQAWYASESAKALGVPSVLFWGVGTDGRHAWFGHLRENGRWRTDAGRGRAQRFAAGMVTDPQTWGQLSEQSLAVFEFAGREEAGTRLMRRHLEAAGCYLIAGDAEKALAAAGRARAADPASPAVWDFLLACARHRRAPAAECEEVMAGAARALAKYPDLEYSWTHRLAASLRARGEGARADALLRDFAAEAARRRADLGLLGEAEAFARSLPGLPPEARLQAFREALSRHSRGSPIGAFDLLVLPFVGHLRGADRAGEAEAAVAIARELLKPRKGSQLEMELRALERLP